MMFLAGVALGALAVFAAAPHAARWRSKLLAVLRPGSAVSEVEDLRGAIDLRLAEGADMRQDREMLSGLLRLRDMDVAEIMVHRTKMTMLDGGKTATEIAAEAVKGGHTRYPVWADTPDNIIGILHSRALFAALQEAADPARIEVEKLLRAPWFVPGSTKAASQLDQFLKRQQQLAIVVDEYGEVMGLITLEDILEEIVGEISDEDKRVASGLRQQKDGSYLADGALPVRDINRALGWSLPEVEATTIAGLIIHEARMIPAAGQAFTFHGFRFEVVRKRRHQLTVIRLTPLPGAADLA